MTIALKAEQQLSGLRETKPKRRTMPNKKKNHRVHCLSQMLSTEQEQKSSPFTLDSLAPVEFV